MLDQREERRADSADNKNRAAQSLLRHADFPACVGGAAAAALRSAHTPRTHGGPPRALWLRDCAAPPPTARPSPLALPAVRGHSILQSFFPRLPCSASFSSHHSL